MNFSFTQLLFCGVLQINIHLYVYVYYICISSLDVETMCDLCCTMLCDQTSLQTMRKLPPTFNIVPKSELNTL